MVVGSSVFVGTVVDVGAVVAVGAVVGVLVASSSSVAVGVDVLPETTICTYTASPKDVADAFCNLQ